ncbi:MAG: hypothetical protein ABSB18_02775 [Candidatus Omnitrophota bacterium]
MESNLGLILLVVFILITAPLTLLIGIFLLFNFEAYLKIEIFLSKSYFLHKDTWLSWLHKSRDSLHLFLIVHRRLFGIICILDVICMLFLANLYLYLLKRL